MGDRTIYDILTEDELKSLQITTYNGFGHSDDYAGAISSRLLEHAEDLPLSELLPTLIACELNRLNQNLDYIGDILEKM